MVMVCNDLIFGLGLQQNIAGGKNVIKLFFFFDFFPCSHVVSLCETNCTIIIFLLLFVSIYDIRAV